MNLSKAYQDATSLPEVVVPCQDTPDEAVRKQLFVNWRNDAVTVIKITELETQITELLWEAVQLAVVFPQTNNHQQIIQKLTRVDTLRKVVDSYGR